MNLNRFINILHVVTQDLGCWVETSIMSLDPLEREKAEEIESSLVNVRWTLHLLQSSTPNPFDKLLAHEIFSLKHCLSFFMGITSDEDMQTKVSLASSWLRNELS
jgi:hypothetical protein